MQHRYITKCHVHESQVIMSVHCTSETISDLVTSFMRVVFMPTSRFSTCKDHDPLSYVVVDTYAAFSLQGMTYHIGIKISCTSTFEVPQVAFAVMLRAVEVTFTTRPLASRPRTASISFNLSSSVTSLM